MIEQDMRDMTGWRQVTCAESEEIVDVASASVLATLTDPDNTYGSGGMIYTEWGIRDRPVLRNYRWPNNPDRQCEHYIPDPLK